MADDFAGKRFLVIGGETPAGRAVAIRLAEAGADVAIASLTASTQAEFAINSALNELWAMGRKGVALAIDASDESEVRRAVKRAEKELGGLDAVVTVGNAVSGGLSDGTRLIVLPDDVGTKPAFERVRTALG